MLDLVPPKLKKWHAILSTNVDDMREDFMMAMKKAIVDFVLRDPAFVESIVAEFDSEQRREVKELGPSWSLSRIKSKMTLEKSLHCINICLSQLLDLWYVKFR